MRLSQSRMQTSVLRERAALLQVFSCITSLICKFHIRQLWGNYRNKLLKGKAPPLLEVKVRMRLVEQASITTMSREAGTKLIDDETVVRKAMMNESYTPTAEKGLLHLQYLSSYWHSFDLWVNFGQCSAARILGCEFEGVLLTTNHLESCNGLLERQHLQRWRRRGRRLCLDVLIKVVIIDVLPAIFEQIPDTKKRKHIREWVMALPGG